MYDAIAKHGIHKAQHGEGNEFDAMSMQMDQTSSNYRNRLGFDREGVKATSRLSTIVPFVDRIDYKRFRSGLENQDVALTRRV